MSLKVLIIGAVALGPKVACRVKRLLPEAEVTLIDRDTLISYGGCGIPYLISGDVEDARQLRETSAHILRDTEFFRQAKGVEVRTGTEALEIDRRNRKVRVKDLETGRESDLEYDKLVLGLGSLPNRPRLPGIDLDGVFNVSNLGDAVKIKERIVAGQVGRAVVIGGGAIGLEMVEALTDLWGVETSLIELEKQLLPGFVSPDLSRMIERHMKEHDVPDIFLSERALRFEGDGAVERVVTDRRVLETDLVLVAVGVHPNSALAVQAGLETTPGGGIKVDREFRTSDPDIYAGGDCIENIHLITGQPAYTPLGSLANRQGRIIGTNVTGGHEEFEGVVGSFILKIFEMAVATAGLCLPRALAAGFDAFSAFVVQADRAHFYPGSELMYLELAAERASGRVLGIQGVSPLGDALACRIDAVAAILKYRPTVRDIGSLEMAYAPPFASAMDILNALGNTAENIMAGKNRTMDIGEFADLFAKGDDEFYCLDVRQPVEAEPFMKKYPGLWLNIPQEELSRRIGDVPRDKEVILLCNSGVRSFEAQVALDHQGVSNTRNLQGGWGALRKCGLDPLESEED